MRLKDALYDGSDPLYAPFTTVSKGQRYWRCPKKFRDEGYAPATVKLIGSDEAQAREARNLTRELIEAMKPKDRPDGTWSWLIHRYRTDRFSPYHKVKANTRAGYDAQLEKLDAAIGHMKIGALTYERIGEMVIGMEAKDRTASYIKRLMTMLRIVAGYGKALRLPEARDVSDMLSEMKFASAPKRSVRPTRDQIRAIVDEADARGQFAFATGLLIQWVYMLRAVDVRGHWLPASPDEGGIIRDGKRWQDGLTWDLIAPDLSGFDKVISKTRKTMGEAMHFDLTIAPEIQSRLRLLGNGKRIGPVIVTERTKLPYEQMAWSRAFARIRDRLGLPKEITSMDTRAGAITEAAHMGVDPWVLRDAAQHSNVSTTDRYARGRSESAAKVVQIRGGTR